MASSATLPPYLMGSAAAHLDEDDEEELVVVNGASNISKRVI